MTINYQCDSCKIVKDNQSLECFACSCGGTFKKYDVNLFVHAFEPYYDRTLRSTVVSERDREKKMKKVKNYSHPEGLYNVRDDKKFMKEMAHIQKHREQYKEATHPGYKARTQREIEKYGEKSFDQNRPDRDRFKPRTYSFAS